MPHSRVPGVGDGAKDGVGDGSGDGADRPVGRVHLDRDAVVGAALAFVDEHGLDGLTMRRLGALMGVEAMSLYHHVTSRAALLDAVADRLVEEMATAAALGDEGAGDWRELLARAAHGVRRVALAHPHVFALVASRAPEAPGLRPPLRTMDWTEEFLEALRRRGFGDEGAVAAYRAFTSFLIGHLLLEVAPHLMQADRPPRDPSVWEEGLAAHPTLVRLGASLAADHGVEEFDEALGLLFPGIAAHRAEGLRAVGPAGVRRGPMTRFGYTLMTEQSGPRELVRYAVEAERRGFDFEVSSDHYFPWLESMGHAPYAWTVLGAVAQATERVGLMTYVTCPTFRYHPAVVAQKAATLQLLAEGRFTLGLGSGERLNEHITGEGWPGVRERQERLVEAVEIIRRLHTGDLVSFQGDYYDVDTARVFDLPDEPVEIGIAAAGERALEVFAPLADHLVAVEPDADLITGWNAVEGAPRIGPGGARAIGQIPICWGPDEDEAVERAHRLFRWFGGGWDVNAELPTPRGFASATTYVTPEDVAASIPCGPDLDAIVEAVSAFTSAGFTDVALVQIGDETQEAFLAEAAEPLLARLRALD